MQDTLHLKSKKFYTRLFELLEIKVSDFSLQRYIDHYSEHSFQAIQEICLDYNIETHAYDIDFEKLKKIEFPVIVQVHNPDSQLIIIYQIDNAHIHFYDENNKNKSISIENFKQKFSGKILIPLTDESSGDPELNDHKVLDKRNKFRKYLFLTGSIATFFMFFFLLYLTGPIHRFSLLILLLNLSGIFVTYHILKIEFNETNPVTELICRKHDCSRVLKSKAASLLPGITMGDLGFIHFVSSSLMIFYAHFFCQLEEITHILYFITLLSLPYTLFSIYYQTIVLKHICPFCICVMVILWIQTIIFYIHFTFPSILFINLLLVGLTYIGAALIWFFIKKLIEDSVVSFSYKDLSHIIKRDVPLFRAQISQLKELTNIPLEKSITVGKPDAIHELVIIISVNCSSCHKIYHNVLTYQLLHPSLFKVHFLLTGTSEASDTNQVIDWIYSVEETEGAYAALKLLDEWKSVNHNISSFNNLCSQKGIKIAEKALEKREQTLEWINEQPIKGNPCIIYQNRILPNYYLFNELVNILKRIKP